MCSFNSDKVITEVSDLQNTTIPLLLCDNVKSVSKWYSVRLTPDDEADFGRGDIIELLQTISMDEWMICSEYSAKKKLHFHLMVRSIFNTDDVKNDFTNYLRSIYPEKWKKEDGNKRYNFKVTNDIVQYIKYMCKDRDYVAGSNINPDYIKWASSKAFKKYSKEAFAVALQELKTSYQDDLITVKQLRTGIIRLKGEYGQPINIQRVNDMVLGLQVKKDPSYADEI